MNSTIGFVGVNDMCLPIYLMKRIAHLMNFPSLAHLRARYSFESLSAGGFFFFFFFGLRRERVVIQDITLNQFSQKIDTVQYSPVHGR